MKKTKKALASLAIAGMVLSMAPMSVFAADATTRLSGADRVATAIAVAANGWTAGSDNVIVVSADDANIVDALAAAPLAGQLNAPILVTYKDALDAQVQQKIVDLKAKNVYAIGALSDATVASLKAIAGVTVEQLQGADRTETAAKVTAKLSKVNGSFVVAYDGKADALSAASFAAANGYSIVIANPDGTIPATEKVVAPTYTVGGQVTVAGATPLKGDDRYATNAAVVNGLTYSYDKVYVANGESLVDALAGAPLAAKTKSPIVLADAMQAVTAANDNLTASSQVIALGGTGAVSDAVLGKVAYQAPATLAVKSVSAINAKQIKIQFNKAVDEDSVIVDAGTDDSLVASVLSLTATTNDSEAVTATGATGELSDDGMTLTVTLAADDTFFDGSYAVTVSDLVKDADGKALDPYSTIITTEDKTAPAVTGSSYDPATGKIKVSFAEPLKTVPTVVRQDGTPVVVSPAFVKGDDFIKFDNTADAGKTSSVYVALATDFAGNVQTAYTGSVSITDDSTALQVVSLDQTASNQVTVVFNKAPEGATKLAAEGNVAAALKLMVGTTVYSNVGNFTVTRDADNSAKFKVAVDLAAAGTPYFGIYDSSTSTKNVTFMFDGDATTPLQDVFGNDITTYSKTVSMNQDKTGPVYASSKLAADEESFVVSFNEKLAVASIDSTKVIVRKSGVDTGAVQSVNLTSDGKGLVIVPNATYVDTDSTIKSGSYTVRLDDGAVKDLYTNKVLATNVPTITVDGATTKVTATIGNLGGVVNKFQVTFSSEVTSSALELTNYTLDGAALPTNTDIYFHDDTKKIVDIVLQSGSVNFGVVGAGTDAMLTVSSVAGTNGITVTTKSGAVDVEDNTSAVLQSASLTGNILTLTFSENIDGTGYDFADFNNDFTVKGGTTSYAPATDTAVVSVDENKMYVTISDVDGNWAAIKGASTITVQTNNPTSPTVLTLVDADNLAVKKNVKVTVSK